MKMFPPSVLSLKLPPTHRALVGSQLEVDGGDVTVKIPLEHLVTNTAKPWQ